ncbi:FAD:protein FMN transferase [Streptococcus phocae subsp. phocae]
MFVTDQIKLMGTVIDIQIMSQRAPQQLIKVRDLLTLYKNRFSANDATSELMAINQAAGIKPITVHPDLFALISLGKKHSLADFSNLNIAIGPLVQTWRISFSDAKVPSQDVISKQLALTDPKQILLNKKQQSVYLRQEGMALDLGALAKGYIADQVMTYLIEDGIDSAVINLGGNVLTHGLNPKRTDGLFYIGIQKPNAERGKHLGILKTNNQSVVTSGIYERHLLVQGKNYHHLLDPHTGYPIKTDMASLTIVAPSATESDTWATRLFGLDTKLVLFFLNNHDDLDGIIVTRNHQVLVSDGLQKQFRLLYN